MKRTRIIAASFVAVIALWFLGVDWSWFVYDCPDCGYGKDIAQYRVFTIPIHETMHESPTIAQRVAADLGVPCEHGNSNGWHKQRWRGLLVCGSPCTNGTYRLNTDDSWYDSNVSAKVAALARVDDLIADAFVQAVFVEHDFGFVRTVLVRAGVESASSEQRMSR